MLPPACGFRATRFAVLLAATLALPGCQQVVALEVSVASSLFNITVQALDLELLVFTVSPKAIDQYGKTLYPLPADAALTVGEHGPVAPEQVTEGEDSYTLRFRMPPEALKALRKLSGPYRMDGRLTLPVDTGVTSYFGVERRTPGRVNAAVTIRPQETGPLTSLGKSVGDFMRGLYQAR
jgi:hypothetical protein